MKHRRALPDGSVGRKMFHVKPHGDMERARTIIAEGAVAMGVALTVEQLDRLVEHLEAVLVATREFNLTAVRDAETAATVHVLDSLAASRHVDAAPEGPIVDIGSGAGFPGVPLAICTHRRVVLLESSRKKAAFLSDVTGRLGLDALVAAERAEEWAAREGGNAPVAVARAVAALPALVELARPILVDEGAFVALKGAPERDELERADAAAALCGFGPGDVVECHVPGLEARRTLVIFHVQAPPRIALPRRTGLAQKRPLA